MRTYWPFLIPVVMIAVSYWIAFWYKRDSEGKGSFPLNFGMACGVPLSVILFILQRFF